MYHKIRTDECLICEGSLIKGMDLYKVFVDDTICYECRKSLNSKLKLTHFDSYRLISFYLYNDEISQLLIRYKDMLDKPLASIFLKQYMWLINIIYKGYKVVLIPSSKTLVERRGFNHLQLMLQECNLDIVDCLEKTDSIQRFTQNRQDVSFKFKYNVKSFDKIIIFDDVMTSGSSMLQAITLLAPISNKIILMSITTNLKLVKER